MAAITASTTLFQDGGAQKTVLLRLTNVTSGDTIDLAAVGPVVFRKLEAVVFVSSAQGSGVVATFNGLAVTLTSSGMAGDSVNLLVIGQG